jgi:dipeptidyl aminopeptidase/acylaminoacyl peptidase
MTRMRLAAITLLVVPTLAFAANGRAASSPGASGPGASGPGASGRADSGPQARTPTDPASVGSAQQAGAGPVDIKDLLGTVRLAGAAWSPDGKQIVYTGNASGRFNVWLMHADGSGAHQLVQSDDAQFGPIWVKDGSGIIFEQDQGGNEMYDLYFVAASGGAPENLTNSAQTNETNPHFSPDGKLIAFQTKEKKEPSTNLAIMEWSTRKVRQLTHEQNPKLGWRMVAWSPDQRFLYADRGDLHEDSSVYQVNVETGESVELTPHQGRVLISASDISPDGKTLLIGSNEKGGFDNVALLDIASRKKTWITDTQWEASPGSFSPGGDRLTYSLNADGRTSIQFVDAKTLKPVSTNIPEGLNFEVGDPSPFSSTGNFLFSHQDSTHAPNLYVLAGNGAAPEQITHVESASLRTAVLPQSQIVHYRSFDGKIISAFLSMPFNLKRDGTNPLIVLPHGGPTGQTVDSFSPRIIALVSRGYIVVAPNVRGSTGYGADFERANYQDLGGGDLQDEVYAVKFMKETGYVDTKKIGITGGSYGGFMTLMAIGKAPDVWAAAVEEYGIIDWYTMLKHSDPYLQEYEKSLLGDPEKDRDKYEAASPIKYLHNERAPLLVLQGENDIRVPREEAAQVVEILKKDGRTVDVVYYPQEGHGFIKREDQIDEITRMIDWFDKYLKAPAA